jgi:SPP1 gp7 family putative phage head morphogenesis protein
VLELKPIPICISEFDGIEERIKRAFLEQLYWPLMRELTLPSKQLQNASDSLLRAIQTGRVLFSRGVFSGRFTASISKQLKSIGATWDRKTETWRLPLAEVPHDLRSAIATSEARFQEKLAAVDRKLSAFDPTSIASNLRMADLLDRALWRVDGDVAATLKGISVSPELTPAQAKKISEEWGENLKLYIRDFAAEEIVKLRKDVQKSVLAGNRFDALVSTIRKSYGATESKAKFLARQETNLLITKYKELRYRDAGVDEYRWQCVAGSPKHPVRPAHKKLAGKIFRWQAPPITSESNEPERRNNPGQDFNCRCVAVPVVRFKPKDTG